VKLDFNSYFANPVVKLNMDAPTDTDAERVILVHGTFASSADDCGEGWWQVGSDAYNELQYRLPPSASLAAEGSVFRWSGDNTERARSKAAAKLLKFLEPLEQSGTRYHLIGHSHGGSVIWAALRMATSRTKSLDQLQSWSTVGTPFLQHQSKSPWNPMSIAYMLLATVLLYPAWRCLRALAKLPYDLAMGNMDNGIILATDEEVGFAASVARVPILKGLELLGVAFTPTDAGTRLGSFDPQSGESVGHFLFGTLEGWLILGAIMLFGYVMLLLGSFFLSSVSEGLRIGWEKRLEQRAFEKYRQRWLGLWTQDDEAINGLRATLELSVSFVGDFVVRERIFLSDLISLPWRPLYRCLAPLYNRMVRPVLDSKIREIVIKAAQGNDRPAAHVVAVSPHPILPPPVASVPPLPDELRVSIRERADQQANDLGPKLRELLAQPSLTTGLEGFSHTLSGRELVHTSYFDHPEVLDLLALNISWSRERSRPRRSSTSAEIVRWFNDFKRLQGVDLPQQRFAPRLRSDRRVPLRDSSKVA
jgi:pimeloyl-ACP methyl ester carboxylesterase